MIDILVAANQVHVTTITFEVSVTQTDAFIRWTACLPFNHGVADINIHKDKLFSILEPSFRDNRLIKRNLVMSSVNAVMSLITCGLQCFSREARAVEVKYWQLSLQSGLIQCLWPYMLYANGIDHGQTPLCKWKSLFSLIQADICWFFRRNGRPRYSLSV